MAENSILFVDDEKSMLTALRRTFRKEGYKIFLANSGKEALDFIAEEKIDIIVSDYLMPEMDGYLLLQKVKELSPDTVRIILSGYSNENMIFRGILTGVIKLYISKPWDDDYIKFQMKKTFDFLNLITSERIRSIIDNNEKLPILPVIYHALIDAINNDKNIKEIAEIIETDSGISSTILHLVNSAYYGLITTSVKKAVSFIGLDSVRDIIVTYSAFEEKKFSHRQLQYLRIFWEHSKYCNAFTHKLHEEIKFKKIESKFFSIGLISNIGYLLMLMKWVDKFEEFFVQLKEYTGINYEEVDKNIFNVTHSDIGSYLLNWWNIPFYTVETVMYHHRRELPDEGEMSISKIVDIADILAWKKLGYLQNMEVDTYYEQIIENM